jgi:segregation and condensation protein B
MSRGRTDQDLKRIVEALLIASDQPVAAARLARVIGGGVDVRRVRRVIDALREEYDSQQRAFQIEEIAEGFQILTRPDFQPYLQELRKTRREERLTPSAVEALAVVAFRQPVLRAEIDDVRGVHCGPLLRALVEKGLVKIVGRQNVPGRPLLYGTTRRFMEHFGLTSIRDLPKLGALPEMPARQSPGHASDAPNQPSAAPGNPPSA